MVLVVYGFPTQVSSSSSSYQTLMQHLQGLSAPPNFS
jgi:hypothetical protein